MEEATNIEACSVFTRWQVYCPKCGLTFYVDSEPESTKEDIMKLKDMECALHPNEDHVIMLA